MTSNSKPLAIVAKCALCSIKTELFVCSHCDEVICQTCVDKHQPKPSETLKEQWNTSRTKYLQLCPLSGRKRAFFRHLDHCVWSLVDLFDKDVVNVEQEIDRIRVAVDQRYINLIQLIEREKKNFLNQIEEHFQGNFSQYENIESMRRIKIFF